MENRLVGAVEPGHHSDFRVLFSTKLKIDLPKTESCFFFFKVNNSGIEFIKKMKIYKKMTILQKKLTVYQKKNYDF